MYNPKFDLYIISKKKLLSSIKRHFDVKRLFFGEFNVFRPKLFVFHRIKRESFCGKSFARAHPVAGFYYVFDVVCGDFSFADVNERACDNPHHIVQKSVARNSDFDVFAVFIISTFSTVLTVSFTLLPDASKHLKSCVPSINRAAFSISAKSRGTHIFSAVAFFSGLRCGDR